jgi:ABC-type phosphate transport system substrate-binding protein
MRKRKIYLTGIIAVAVLAGMGNPESILAEEVSRPQMTYEEYPRIDGSLACVPLCEKLAVEVTGCSEVQAEATMADFLNTNPSYLSLAEGQRDIILAYEPSDSTKETLEEYDPLDMQPIGKDALVFIVNEDNPVESLTQQQVYDIYTGAITNWSEVGGDDIEIRAFQRPETSGSQTMMRKLLLGDAQMIEADTETIAVGMEDIIEALTRYDNSANALGYSVYYYASEMFSQPGLKFLQIDGVEPSNETIRSGEYPLINEFYCVTNEQSSEKAIEIRDWLISEDGQSFVEECGYVPVQ